MKTLLSFQEFLNESLIVEASAASLTKKLRDYTAQSFIDEKDDDGITQDITAICKILGEDPSKVFSIDEYSTEEDSALEKAFGKVQNLKYDGIADTNQFTGDAEIRYNPTAKVIEYVDMQDQFTMYLFTAKSNF
jgi:hypothetical protein